MWNLQSEGDTKTLAFVYQKRAIKLIARFLTT
jgi:hypothetical protein